MRAGRSDWLDDAEAKSAEASVAAAERTRRRRWILAAGLAAAVLLLGVGLAWALLFRAGLAFGDRAIRGSDLSPSVVRFLRSEGLIEEDEEILYFYSRGLLAQRDHGSFFTDRGVCRYRRADGELVVQRATYPEIVRIYADFRDPIEDETGVQVETATGERLYLCLEGTVVRDPPSTALLREVWQRSR